MHSDAELLKAYLADRDVSCPKCGYSLKGCVAENCPECGSVAVLTIGSISVPKVDLWLLRVATIIFAGWAAFWASTYTGLLWSMYKGGLRTPFPMTWSTHVWGAFKLTLLSITAILVARAFHRRKSALITFHQVTIRWGMIVISADIGYAVFAWLGQIAGIY